MTNKAQAQLAHARRRARERFGLELNEHDLRHLAHRIQRGESQLVARQTNRMSIHRVECQGQQVLVAYDRRRKTVVTFLYEELENA